MKNITIKRNKFWQHAIAGLIVWSLLFFNTSSSLAQQNNLDSPSPVPEETPTPTPEPEEPLVVNAGSDRQLLINKSSSFDAVDSQIPEHMTVSEILWDFGDGTQATGDKVSHTYETAGTYEVTLTITTDKEQEEDTLTVQVFEHIAILVTDNTVPEDRLQILQQRASQEGLLLFSLRARGGGPDVLTEETLTNQLIEVRDHLAEANLIITWTSGSVGPNVISKFAQHLRKTEDISRSDLNIHNKGVVILSDTPFGVLAPAAQSAFDQLNPSYVLLTRPQALDLLLSPYTAEQAQNMVFDSPVGHRLLGTFSARTVRDLGITNFMSFGINWMVNRGVPINSITLILMLPIIATILSFSRQVIGIKAFGIVTPAMTTLSFLVIGLQYGLIIFISIILAGTATRMLIKKLQLLYLPRMALVLTGLSLAILLLLGLSTMYPHINLLSFSIFPILILTLLSEEFIAVQFKSGARTAFNITAWTLILVIACYFIVSWGLVRTIVISYPEVILLTIPINILLGRWTGLRLTEYFRFRNLLRYSQ